MPLEYLREIAHLKFPLSVDDEANIDKLRVLLAADLVLAILPIPTDNVQVATVLAITKKGQEVLALHVEPPP